MSIEVMNDQQAAKAAGGRGRAHGQMEWRTCQIMHYTCRLCTGF